MGPRWRQIPQETNHFGQGGMRVPGEGQDSPRAQTHSSAAALGPMQEYLELQLGAVPAPELSSPGAESGLPWQDSKGRPWTGSRPALMARLLRKQQQLLWDPRVEE